MTETREHRLLGVISARGGSKGIPKKNIAAVAGHPLIAWTIAAAQESGVIDRLIVSTDDPDIEKVARQYGAETPFVRPAELATDTTPSTDVVLHAVEWLEHNQGYRPTHVLLLQPTSPLRSATDIREALRLALERRADSVVSVCPAQHHPLWMQNIDGEGHLRPFLAGREIPTRRQDLPPAYGLNGAIYLARRDWFLAHKRFYGEGTYAYVMPPERSLDVDTPWELSVAEMTLGKEVFRGDHHHCRS